MTRLPATALLAVAGLVALAGCGGISGDERPQREPFEVPEPSADGGGTGDGASTDETDGSGDGSFDAFGVVNRHARAVANVSVAVRESRVVRYPNGTVRYDRTSEWYVGADDGYYRLDRVDGTPEGVGYAGGRYRYERWVDGDVGVERARIGNRTTYDPERTLPPDVDRADRLFALLTALEPTVTVRRTDAGDMVRVLRASTATVPDSLDARAVSGVENVSFVAVVSQSGAVERYRLTYTGIVEGRPVRVVERVAFEPGTTVPRPDWVEEGLRVTGQTGDGSTTTTAGAG